MEQLPDGTSPVAGHQQITGDMPVAGGPLGITGDMEIVDTQFALVTDVAIIFE